MRSFSWNFLCLFSPTHPFRNSCNTRDSDNNNKVVKSPHSSILAWKISWMEEPGGLQSMGSRSWTWLSNFTFTFHSHALEKEIATHSSVLAWRIPGMGEPDGLPSMWLHRLGHDWSSSKRICHSGPASASTWHLCGPMPHSYSPKSLSCPSFFGPCPHLGRDFVLPSPLPGLPW